MHGSVVSQQEVSSDKGTSALEALERTFFRICKAMETEYVSDAFVAIPARLFSTSPSRPRHDRKMLRLFFNPSPFLSTPRSTKKGNLQIRRKQEAEGTNLRDLSCLLRCSLLLNARLQNWHLYFFSGVFAGFFAGGDPGPEAAVAEAVFAGIVIF